MLRIVSENERTVQVRNLKSQTPGKLESIGIKNLTGWILCKYHNNFLSKDIDTAGIRTLEAFDKTNQAAGNPDEPYQIFRVNGFELERWMLKTLWNGLYSGNFVTSMANSYYKLVLPPKEHLEVIFRNGQLPKGLGLYINLGRVGDVTTSLPEILKIEPFDNDLGVVGVRVYFFNFQFILVLVPLPPSDQLPGMIQNAHLSAIDISYLWHMQTH